MSKLSLNAQNRVMKLISLHQLGNKAMDRVILYGILLFLSIWFSLRIVIIFLISWNVLILLFATISYVYNLKKIVGGIDGRDRDRNSNTKKHK